MWLLSPDFLSAGHVLGAYGAVSAVPVPLGVLSITVRGPQNPFGADRPGDAPMALDPQSKRPRADPKFVSRVR
jgi:hypothetical protein